MKISTWTSRSLLAACIVVAAVIPTAAFASIKIADVMYNPPGADEGHEWIEVANTGPDPINLAAYRLFEGGINHKLAVAVGTSTLAADAKAIITTDPGQYLADNPRFAGAIFKSSFSLSNTGETIALKDASLAVVDSYSYVAPVVLKEPAPAKAPKVKVSKTSTTASKKTSATTYNSSDQAVSPNLALPQLPDIPSLWLYGLGLATLLILGAGAALYAKPVNVTQSVAGEFELE